MWAASCSCAQTDGETC